jgi:trk system potassium uptake protein TrkH
MARITRTITPTYRRPVLARWLDALLAVTALAAVASLVMTYGGWSPEQLPVSPGGLRLLQAVIVGVLITDRLARLLLARQRLAYLRGNWLDYALIAGLLAALVTAYELGQDVLSAGAAYVIITQAYILLMLLLRAVGANIRLAGSGLPPSWLLIGSFAAMCVGGSLLLMLPAAVRPDAYAAWTYPGALFTATSATCVTGLIVVDTGSHFTLFGQAVILTLIQLGGLGIMIFGTLLGLLAGKALTARSSEVLGEMLASDRVGELARIVRFVVLATLIFEAVGAAMLYPMFRGLIDAAGQPVLSCGGAVWQAVFHSISAFCNAGFSLWRRNMMAGVGDWPVPLRDTWQMLGVIAPLIVFGGLGFPVLEDLGVFVRDLARRLTHRRRTLGRLLGPVPRPQLSLHSKVTLVTTVFLLVLGALLLSLVEIDAAAHPVAGRDGDWSAMAAGPRMRAVVFQSITARTAGFNTIDMADLSSAGKAWMCVLMSIGGSPASTAGGMKTVTFALLVLAAWSTIRQRSDVEVFRRCIPLMLLKRAVTIALLYSVLVIVVTILLAVALRGEAFIDVLFEACSACGTVGLSTGVTHRLNLAGELIITGAMFVGRLGPLTLLMALTAHFRRAEYAYPCENVVLG